MGLSTILYNDNVTVDADERERGREVSMNE